MPPRGENKTENKNPGRAGRDFDGIQKDTRRHGSILSLAPETVITDKTGKAHHLIFFSL